MKKILNYLLNTLFPIALFLFVFIPLVHANPAYFTPTVQTSVATTSPVFMTAGTATTTLTLDSYYQETLASNVKSSSAILLMQFTASSTGSTLKMRQEFSQDGIDWYPQTGALATSASTTPFTGTFAETQFSVPATTGDFGGSGTATRQHYSMTLTSPTRWMRVKFYLPAGSPNGALWAQIVPNRERSETR